MNPLLLIDQRLMGLILICIFFFLTTFIPPSYGYDPLDPSANITISWDLMQENDDTYDVKVSLYNFQLYRHVSEPSWKLSWTWGGDEAIWNMWGAEATLQGNCSKYRGKGELPHCCEKRPVIVDLMPGAPYNLQVSNCCKGGILSSITQDPTKIGSAFQMSIGKEGGGSGGDGKMPENFDLGLPGYTCGPSFQVSPTRFSQDRGRRWTQALETWNVTCVYSQFLASPTPTCCVSLSAFYNSTIVPCPQCSCSCQGLDGAKCLKEGEIPSFLQLPREQDMEEREEGPDMVTCSQHMCPIKIHWHIKESYTQYWRVKITITNLNVVKNYSQWSLVVAHPNLQSLTQVFSFNYHPINLYGNINDTGVFWGIQYYNDMLPSGESGNVQSEMLLHKDGGNFTFKGGWAFPRRISFNGDACVMPPPDQYPILPNHAHTIAALTTSHLLASISILLVLMF